MYKHILMPTDGSALAGKAIDAGLALAQATGARLTAMVAVEPFNAFALAPEQIEYNHEVYASQARAEAHRVLDAIVARATEMGLRCDQVVAEAAQPHDAIIEVAGRTGADLIVMASHGRRGMAAVVLGSVTQKVLTHTTTPVLVYR
jgi:nucleotide-binding universal stress UspA family protein